MRMTAKQIQDIEQRQALQCPIHIHHMDNCEWCARISADEKHAVDAVEFEAPLQEQIEAECRRRQWPFVRTRMNKPTTFTFPGTPDFVIAASNGRVLWIETKSKIGKLTSEQLGFQMMLNQCGHILHVVRSFTVFLEIAKEYP